VLLSECLVFGYLRKTATDGIIFGNDDKLTFYGTSDASHAVVQGVANWHPTLWLPIGTKPLSLPHGAYRDGPCQGLRCDAHRDGPCQAKA
jgi:hypothetical protein